MADETDETIAQQEADEPPQDRHSIMLGKTLRDVGRIVLLNDREDVVDARREGRIALPMAAIVIGIRLDRDGQFSGYDLGVFHPGLGYQIRTNVPQAPPSEHGDEPGWFESLVKPPVDFSHLRELVTGGINAELHGMLSDMLPAMVKELVDEQTIKTVDNTVTLNKPKKEKK